MFYFTDFVYPGLYVVGTLGGGGLKIVAMFFTVILQFYTNFRNMAFGIVFMILFQVFYFTQQQIL